MVQQELQVAESHTDKFLREKWKGHDPINEILCRAMINIAYILHTGRPVTKVGGRCHEIYCCMGKMFRWVSVPKVLLFFFSDVNTVKSFTQILKHS